MIHRELSDKLLSLITPVACFVIEKTNFKHDLWRTSFGRSLANWRMSSTRWTNAYIRKDNSFIIPCMLTIRCRNFPRHSNKSSRWMFCPSRPGKQQIDCHSCAYNTVAQLKQSEQLVTEHWKSPLNSRNRIWSFEKVWGPKIGTGGRAKTVTRCFKELKRHCRTTSETVRETVCALMLNVCAVHFDCTSVKNAGQRLPWGSLLGEL